MKIGILYNLIQNLEKGFEADKIADNEVVHTVESLTAVLEKKHTVVPVLVDNEVLFGMEKSSFDIIFNLCEGIDGNQAGEYLAAAVLETKGIPFTGADSLALGLCVDKTKTKGLLIEKGIPTPRFQLVKETGFTLKNGLEFPLMVKPAHEDGSIGISDNSVVYNEEKLYEQVDFILKNYRQPALIEEFIDGRELNAAILGNHTQIEILPVSEIVFELPAGKPKILTYEAKWYYESEACRLTNGKCPAELDPEVLEKVRKSATDAFYATGCRDYARVDFRLKNGVPYVIEVNPNPDISENTGFIRSAKASGLTYEQTIERILDAALSRYPENICSEEQKIRVNTRRLAAEKVSPADSSALVRWFNDPDVSRFMSDSEQTWDESRFFNRFFAFGHSDIDLIMRDTVNGEPLGYGQIYDIDAGKTCEISYLIGEKRYLGQGYGREIVHILLHTAFCILNLNSVMARVFLQNEPSMRIFEKAGFRRVGVMQQSDLIAGKPADEAVFQLTRDEYLGSSYFRTADMVLQESPLRSVQMKFEVI